MLKEEWWRLRDLNPRHKDYDSSALPTELNRRLKEGHFMTRPAELVNPYPSLLFFDREPQGRAF